MVPAIRKIFRITDNTAQTALTSNGFLGVSGTAPQSPALPPAVLSPLLVLLLLQVSSYQESQPPGHCHDGNDLMSLLGLHPGLLLAQDPGGVEVPPVSAQISLLLDLLLVPDPGGGNGTLPQFLMDLRGSFLLLLLLPCQSSC